MSLYVERIVVHPATRRGPGFDPATVEIVWRDLSRVRWYAVVER